MVTDNIDVSIVITNPFTYTVNIGDVQGLIEEGLIDGGIPSNTGALISGGSP